MFDAIIEMGTKMSRLSQKKILNSVIATPTIQSQMIDYNQAQLQAGEDANGRSTGVYSKASVQIYGKEPGRITLHETGEFYDSMRVVRGDSEFEIKANTRKPDRDLLERWPNALGLTDENMNEMIPEIKELTIEKIYDEIL